MGRATVVNGRISCFAWLIAVQLLRGGDVADALRAFRGDAIEELGSWLISWVLPHQLARKGVAQDGLAQALRVLQLEFEIEFEMVDDR